MRTGLRSGTIDAYFPEALFASAAGYIPPLIPRHSLAHKEIFGRHAGSEAPGPASPWPRPATALGGRAR